MAEGAKEPTNDLLAGLITQASEAAGATHASRQRADDDASYANKAKLAAEEHSKAIAALKGQAEADAAWFTTTKQGVDQAQATIAQIRAEAESSKQAIAEALGAIEQARTAAKSGGDQAETFRAQAEKAAADAAAHQKSTIASSSSAGTAREAATKASDQVGEILAKVTALAAKTDEEATKAVELRTAIAEANDEAQVLVKSMASADAKSKEALSIVDRHQTDLARLKKEFADLNARIESVLPYATSAGLATAFREQKVRFEKPQLMWLRTFVATLLALLASSLWGLPAGDSWEAMTRHFVNRLPLIAPLIWLAIYAGRHYGLALRLQEEYAYKEAVSAAFEGYKREMNTVGAAADGRSPLVTLCENVLNTLGQRPGRIYEGKHEDITPLASAASSLKDAATAAKDAVKTAAGIVRPSGGS